MKKSFRILAVIIAGLIITALTLGIFFLQGLEKSNFYRWALFFILLSEVALFAGIGVLGTIPSNLSRVFVRSGETCTLALYFLITLISCLFAEKFKNINTFISIEIIIIAFAAVLTLSIFVSSRRIFLKDQKTINDRRIILACQKRVFNLFADNKNKKYDKQLSSLYDSIRFCDKIGSSSVDEKIALQITKLEKALKISDKSDDIDNICNEISTLIKQRSAEILEAKRGEF